ncbi:DNAJ domain containing protein, putative [Leishmania tarentolae]|uniref:DNAJ domain containing protein, putative n=1 Tax=Leishmania tarentolae TaxID=5689 RepID=A0A640KE89_LEITA|nr:DNAJ domain containing protein, putative [Leishmania tarentolae]
MDKQDYYTILGISRTANKDAIRQAYKLKALQLHPDKNPNGEAIFKLVVNAYHTLNDPTKRSAYDRELMRRDRGFGAHPYRQAAPQPSSPAAYQSSSCADAGTSRKPRYATDEQLFKDAYEQYKKSPFSANANGGFRGVNAEGTFAEWFKQKQEELRRAEEVTKAKAEYAKSLEREEKRRADEWRDMQRRREEEREEEMRQAKDQREREREMLRRKREAEAKEKKEAEKKAQMEAYAAMQREQQADVERHLRDLASQKRELAEERRRLAEERAEAANLAAEHRMSRDIAHKQRGQELADAVRRADEKVREAQEQQMLNEARERIKAEERAREEERKSAEEELLLEAERERESQRQREAQAAEQERNRTTAELGEQRKRVIAQMMSERRKHEEEVSEMRRETDRIEAEMKAKLEALRAAKNSGQVINLDEWKL